MNYPTQFGLPQVIILLALAGSVVLFVLFLRGLSRGAKWEDKYGNKHYQRPRRFHVHHLGGSIILVAIAFLLIWIAGIAQTYLGLTGKVLVAHVRAAPVANSGNIPMTSVDLILYDQNGNQASENTYIVNGDEVYIGGDIIQYQSLLNLIGFHSGYKVTKLEGMYSDVNLEEHSQHTVEVLNGGDDSLFNDAYNKGLSNWAVTAAYKNGSTVPRNSVGYNICASQDAIVPQPDTVAC